MKKPPISFLAPICAATIAGVALWLSRASFDVAGTTAAPIRVAMLPSLAELMGFIVLALLIAAGLASMVRNSRSFWEPATDALLPLFSLSLLILPYLPWIADWMPALRLFAGPGRILIWIVVIGQVLWLFLPQLSQRIGLPAPVVSRSTGAALFGIASVALSAPFVLNVRAFPSAFVDVFNTVRRLPSATLSTLPAGSLGVLFDQEYGVVAYAPVLALGFIGLAGMLRDRSHRRLAIVLSVAAALLIALPATVDPWWSKSMMPGRPVLLLLPLLGVPIAWLYARLEPSSPARAAAQALLLVSVAVTLTLVVFNSRVPALQEGDGSSALLQWMSPTWQLSREAPTYVAGVSRASSLRVLLWLVAFGMAAWLLARRSTMSDGRAALVATLSCAVLFIAVATTSAAIVPDATQAVRRRGARDVSPARDIRSDRAPDCAALRWPVPRPARRIAAIVRPVCGARTANRSTAGPRCVERTVPAARRPICARSQRIRRRRIDAGLVDVAAAWPRRPADRKLAPRDRPRPTQPARLRRAARRRVRRLSCDETG